jgi:CheY-like chemotaxis protein
VWLPVKTKTRERHVESARLQEPTKDARILFIDDEKAILRSIKRVLHEYSLVVAPGGLEALDILETDRNFDVVFCDLMMPEISGMEVYEKAVALYPKLADRFVLVTGGAFTPRAKAFLQEVALPRIEKPFDEFALKELIEERVHITRKR